MRMVCGNRSLVRVAPGIYVFGGEAVSGSMALSSRCDGTKPGRWDCPPGARGFFLRWIDSESFSVRSMIPEQCFAVDRTQQMERGMRSVAITPQERFSIA